MSKPEDLLGFDLEDEELEDNRLAKYRNDRFSLEQYVDPAKLVTWMNRTRRLPLEKIDEVMVDQTYAAAVWLFRSAAVAGHLNAAKAVELWLKWAQPIITNSKRERKKPMKSVGSVEFLPRNPNPGDEQDES